MDSNKWIYAAVAVGVIVLGYLAFGARAQAADLGGNCCADLEERIAELEATVAKKGNRKVSLHVYGTVNKAVSHWDVDISNGGPSFNNEEVIDNSTDPTLVGFSGSAKINDDLSAGYRLEIGLGERGFGGANELYGNTDGVYVHRSYWWVASKSIGTLSVGLVNQATDEITWMTPASGTHAARPLSLRPINGPQIGEVLDLWDGQRTSAIRYDSPALAGFTLSASWASGGFGADTDGGDVWDVALRYAGEFGAFKVAAGIGYREGIIIRPNPGIPPAILPSVDTIALSGGVMHTPTGLFINGAYGDLDATLFFGGPNIDVDIQGWHVQGGVEQKFLTSLGKTTLFIGYGEIDIDQINVNPTFYQAGFNQAIDAAAMDLYLIYNHFDADTTQVLGANVEVETITGGGRIKF